MCRPDLCLWEPVSPAIGGDWDEDGSLPAPWAFHPRADCRWGQARQLADICVPPVEVAGTIPRYRTRLPYKGSRWRRHAGRRGQTIETNPFGAIIIPRGNDKGSATQAP